MSSSKFSRDPNTPSRRLARALASADESLHVSLIQARIAAGLSQQDVADLIGVSQPTVAAFERYDNDPKLSTIRRYAHAVGVTVTHEVSRDGVPVGWSPVSSTVTFSTTTHAQPGVIERRAPDHLSVVRAA